MNRLYRFPNNIPPPKLQIYWDEDTKQWELWFGDEAPWVKDGDFTPFNFKLYDYSKEEITMASPKDKCGRCGKNRSWHLGLGGMGLCIPFDEDPEGRTGGFIEPEASGEDRSFDQTAEDKLVDSIVGTLTQAAQKLQPEEQLVVDTKTGEAKITPVEIPKIPS